MSLATSGTYIIKSKSTDGAFVGRDVREDMSLLPKRVLLLPKEFEDVPKWEIVKSSDNTYILRTRGSHTSNISNLLFGVLLPEPEPTKWKIEAQPQHGKHIYTITVADGNRADGWVSPAKVYEQIAIRPLIVAPSIPPRFPTNELFEITLYDE